MARSTKPWTGKTDDSAAPPKVRQRVRDRFQSICYLCKSEIKDIEGFDLDHVVAIINGGANSEENLAPVHRHCHRAKSVLDVKEKAKVAKVRGKHTGAIRPAGTIKSPGFTKTAKAAARAPRPSLPPKQLYQRQPETQS